MSRLRSTIGICRALAALALFGLAPATRTSASDQVPFLAHGVVIIVSQTDLGGGLVEFVFDVALNGTYLGNSTGTATFVLNTATGQFSGAFCMNSPNGVDSLCFDATAGQLTPTADPNVFDFVETITVTSGTGAFANATGGGTGTGQFRPLDGLATVTLTGTVSRPYSP